MNTTTLWIATETKDPTDIIMSDYSYDYIVEVVENYIKQNPRSDVTIFECRPVFRLDSKDA